MIAAVFGAAGLPACGPALFVFDVVPASSAVSQAEQAGAEEWAPYHYWLARLYLDKAAEEANEANYQDAIQLAERAREHADIAHSEARERRRDLSSAERTAGAEASSSGSEE